MEPLRTGDPSRLGRYRLLRRLGAGGMGVVFLARAPGGAIAAVKTVRSSYADETGFRTRFRREIEAARQVRSPWVVPLLDADADAETPWLATSYVPGPSLAEAVDTFGPLSLASVRVLGVRLAEALGAVHGAGLVHRDVKPGNVLLAPDGPRLIDFGIARAPEATALTSSGVIVGSPGFLSPSRRGPGAARSAHPAMCSRWGACSRSPRPGCGRSAAAERPACCCVPSTRNRIRRRSRTAWRPSCEPVSPRIRAPVPPSPTCAGHSTKRRRKATPPSVRSGCPRRSPG